MNADLVLVLGLEARLLLGLTMRWKRARRSGRGRRTSSMSTAWFSPIRLDQD